MSQDQPVSNPQESSSSASSNPQSTPTPQSTQSPQDQKKRVSRQRFQPTSKPRRQHNHNQNHKPSPFRPENAPLPPLSEEEASEILHINHLSGMTPDQLAQKATALELENIPRKKHDIILSILKISGEKKLLIKAEGLIEVMPEQSAYLRSSENAYQATPGDLYIAASLIRRHGLQTGDKVSGIVAQPKTPTERHFALYTIETINDRPANASPKRRTDFEDLTPIHPCEPLKMSTGNGSTQDIAPKMIDLISPIGKGQRGLIVAQPKAGKTMLLESIARSIDANHPECHLIVLLIDERPEEVTEMQRLILCMKLRGEVIYSTFDRPAQEHVHAAKMAMNRAIRLVEDQQDVVIILDSLTRLARASNTVTPSSGKILSGGVDANALQQPKRFFGAARNIEEGGSLTILASALEDTGSKMDDLIYEEFKGTGNMEIHLNRDAANAGIFPAFHIRKSGTRREDLIVDADSLQKMWILRKYLTTMDDIAALEFLIDRLKQAKTIDDLFKAMKSK